MIMIAEFNNEIMSMTMSLNLSVITWNKRHIIGNLIKIISIYNDNNELSYFV